MTEDEAIQLAARRLVFPLDRTGFATCYAKMLKAFRCMRRYDARHDRAVFGGAQVGRRNRLLNHRWKSYSKAYAVAVRSITKGPYLSWTSGCGRLGVCIPADRVQAIARGRSAAFPIAECADRTLVFFELPYTNPDTLKAREDLRQLVRNVLREYGTWDEDELADDGANLVRVVWHAACGLIDEFT